MTDTGPESNAPTVQAAETSPPPEKPRGLLGLIERIGNALPDPVVLFVGGALLVMLLSGVAAWQGWQVTPMVAQAQVDEAGEAVIDAETGEPVIAFVDKVRIDPETGERVLDPTTGEPVPEVIEPQSLLSSEGLYWALSSMVDNFINFPPLGVVLVGMLGIGVAERTGMFGAMLRAFAMVVPPRFYTPAMVFLGIMSSMGLDAGYVVLPPLAAALYLSAGRSPLLGIAAVFAGVAAGFNANLFPTGLDPLLAGLSTTGAQIVDPDYNVAATCNWWFMIASTVVMTGVGWFVGDVIIERRMAGRPASEGGPDLVAAAEASEAQRLKPEEVKGLSWASGVILGVLGLVTVSALIPGWPMHGNDGPFAKWVASIVPIIFLVFIGGGLTYGIVVGTIRSSADAAKAMIEAIAAIAPIVVLAFFAAQFIEYLGYSRLDQMLAFSGGRALAAADLPVWALIIGFILLVGFFNLFIGSMSAKYAMVAPIFIPMLMVVGISPELTQATYRIGDSVTNTITPLNAYLIIILMFMQRYAKSAGMGTLISTMLPFSLVFLLAWTVLLLAWIGLGLELGPAGPLSYPPK